MYANSHPVRSKQTRPSSTLISRLQKYQNNKYQQPLRPFSQSIFKQVEQIRQDINLPIILDSGCGTGESSKRLATDNPNCLVIGIDKSAHRLRKTNTSKLIYCLDNLLLVRADLIDFWRLAVDYNWRLQRHYLLYPNPWPKKKHETRRWYAHPVLPTVLKLGGYLECRSNWQYYIEEFSRCLSFFEEKAIAIERIASNDYLSPFEKKYSQSGHHLYRIGCQLGEKLVPDNQKTGS